MPNPNQPEIPEVADPRRPKPPGQVEASLITITAPEAQVHVLFHDQPLRGPFGKDKTPADLRTAVFAIRQGKVGLVTGTIEDDDGKQRPSRINFLDLPQHVRQHVARLYAEKMTEAASNLEIV